MSDLQSTGPVRAAQGAGHDFVQTSAFEWLSRAGFVARAVVYAIIGILAFKLAVGSGGKLTNQQGAMRTLAHQPFGKYLLTLVAVGLAGYALWRLFRSALGRGPEGTDKGFDRLAALGSGLAYGAMSFLAVEILLGAGPATTNTSPKKSAAGVFTWPAGTWLVGLVGLGLVGIALYQGYQGVTQNFFEKSKVEEMRPEVKRWIGRLGTTGHLARMVVFGLVGVFLIRAAVDYNPRKAVGLDGALAKVVHASYGSYLLGIVALGLIAFALFSLSDARYRRI
jgi:succinate dehydrogenase/fumarate reductase cytochrome b subunit